MKSLGWTAVFPYFILFYYIPLLLMSIYGPHINFNNSGNVFLLFIVISSTLLLSKLFSSIKIRFPVVSLSKLPNFFASEWLFIAIGIIVMPLAFKFATDFGVSYRYSSENLSQSGYLPQLILLYKGLFASYILYSFILSLNNIAFNPLFRLSILINTFNWGLCANGAADILWISIGLVLVVRGSKSRSFFVVNSTTYSLKQLTKKLVILIISVIAMAGLVFFGFANKVGFDSAVEIFRNELVSKVFYYMYYRLSVFISSLDLILSRGWDLELYGLAVQSITDNFLYRISTIFGFSPPNPPIEGLNRLNYLLLYDDPRQAKTGASAGPLGSFAYLPILPFNLIICALYIAVIKNSFSKVIKINKKEKISILSIIFLIIVNYTFFHNPIASYLKVGPELFRTLLFIYAFASAYKIYRNDYK